MWQKPFPTFLLQKYSLSKKASGAGPTAIKLVLVIRHGLVRKLLRSTFPCQQKLFSPGAQCKRRT
jgi:hypothetical protein